MSTKDRILDAALTLFSENGYDGTSVEQIANIVGIKAPSLYKHYKGKEEILNALIDAAETRYEEMFGSEHNIGKLPESVDEFFRITMDRAAFTMRDLLIRKIRKFLVQEQFRNERLSEITTRHQIDALKMMFSRIISGMMDKGLFKKDDPKMLALELISPVVLMIAKADRSPQTEAECLENIEKHIRHFCDTYAITPSELQKTVNENDL